MAGPWEKYQQPSGATEGPWSKYQTPSVESEIPTRAVEYQKTTDPNQTPMQRAYWAVRPYAAPVVETLGGVVPGLLAGAATGPVGGLAAAGLGYGIAKEGMELADVYLGGKPQRQGAEQVIAPVYNVMEGATQEVAGRVLGPLIAKGAGKVADVVTNRSTQKAVKIAREALGPDLDAVKNALFAAKGQGVTAAQATADVNSPAWQALVDRATARDPRFPAAIKQLQESQSLNALAELAGGRTATEVRAATDLQKQTLNDITSPARQAALNRANQGQRVTQLEASAAAQEAQATKQVETVRRMEGARVKAMASYEKALADDTTMGWPEGATRGLSLAADAENWATKAANASLDLGQGARFSRAAAQSLRDAGIQPLKTEPIIRQIQGIKANPSFAANLEMKAAVDQLSRDLAEWTGKGGVIDAVALDAIRKNSVNAAVRKLNPNMDPNTQQKLASKVMSELRPALVDAIENAGGKGYRAYLQEYTEGMQKIAEQKLKGEALRLWKQDRNAFVRLVQGESPEVVEKTLGPGNYDIAQNLANGEMEILRERARQTLTNLKVKEQADAGQEALKKLLLQNLSVMQLPTYLNNVATSANKALKVLEKRIGTKTMDKLQRGLQTPEGAINLLNTLPGPERVAVLKALNSTPTAQRVITAPVVREMTNNMRNNPDHPWTDLVNDTGEFANELMNQ